MRIPIRAVEIHAEGNVAHERDAALFRVRSHGPPLVECDPLGVFEKRFALGKTFLHFSELFAQPIPRGLSAAMFLPPLVPGFAPAIFFHEGTEECVIVEPSRFHLAEGVEG